LFLAIPESIAIWLKSIKKSGNFSYINNTDSKFSLKLDMDFLLNNYNVFELTQRRSRARGLKLSFKENFSNDYVKNKIEILKIKTFTYFLFIRFSEKNSLFLI